MKTHSLLAKITVGAALVAVTTALPATAAADRGHGRDAHHYRSRVTEHVDHGRHHGRDHYVRHDRYRDHYRHAGRRHDGCRHDPWLNDAEWLILGGLGWHILLHD